MRKKTMVIKKFVSLGLVSCLLTAMFAPGVAAQSRMERDEQSRLQLQERIEKLEKEMAALRKAREGTGSAGSTTPFLKGEEYRKFQDESANQKGSMVSSLDERLTIGGLLEFEFFDARREGRDLGNLDTDGDGIPDTQFGRRTGASQFRVRRFLMSLDIDFIKDVHFRTTLVIDPVVQDEADNREGSVDLDEAYFHFGNLLEHLFDIEDPTHTYFRVGNYYRWERGFFDRRHASYSLAATSFYRDEVTGLAIGGDMESGIFYRVSIDNGSVLSARDGGIERLGATPIFHDNELSGDLNANKDISFGLGFKNHLEEPNLDYRLAISYRTGKLARSERVFLANTINTIGPGGFNSGTDKDRIGLLAGFNWVCDTFEFGLDFEFWRADDGNAEREVVTLAPHLRLPLDPVTYQGRQFFTAFSLGYRLGYLHQSAGIPNPTAGVFTQSILNDRKMHTLSLGLEVTRDVDMILELNTFEASGPEPDDTEWLLRWSIRF